MENLEIDAPRSQERGEAASKNLADTGTPVQQVSAEFLDDPAAFLILHLIHILQVSRVSELKSYFSRSPDLLQDVDSILSRLEDENIVRVEGDAIVSLTARALDFGGNPAELKRFLPNLFRLAANRVLKNEEENPGRRKARREMVRWFALSDNPEVAAEAKAIDLEYKAKMVALQEKAMQGKMGPANGIRFAGIVDCVLEPEDFS